MTRPRTRRIGIIASSGGHLMQLYALRPAWSTSDHFVVTFDTLDARALTEGSRRYWASHPTNRSIRRLVLNSILALRVLRRERPTHLVSTGAAVAVPFFVIGRLLGARIIYIEVYDRIDRPSLTGRLVRPITHRFLVQWPEQLPLYRGAELLGPLL